MKFADFWEIKTQGMKKKEKEALHQKHLNHAYWSAHTFFKPNSFISNELHKQKA